MQRYRVNLPLLIGLVVGSIVVVGGGYGLYTFQKSRNASRLLVREEAARAEGELKESVNLLVDYLRIRPGDQDAMVRLSEALADIAEEPRSERVDIRKAMGQMETTVRDFPELDGLRRRLVDLYMSPRVRMLKPALDHVSQLLNRNPNDPELEAMRSQCLFAAADKKAVPHAYTLIGYDEKTESFNPEKAVAPNDPKVYARLAFKLRSDLDEPELADEVINRMVEANPTDGEALLARGQYFERADREDDAKADIQAALEIDPDNPSIVTANASRLAKDERYDDAEALLTAALAKNPAEPSLFQWLAEVAIRKQQYDEAIAICDRGIAAVPTEQSTMLLVQKARLQLGSENPEAAADTIKVMRNSQIMQAAYPDYLEGRLLMSQNKWFEAAKVFDEYQGFFSQNPAMGVELNVMLGLCREKLGQKELAIEAFQRALRLEPKNTMADLGVQRLRSQVGGGGGNGGSVSIYAALNRELAKPEAEQDWAAFDRDAQQYIERMQLGDAMLAVLRGEVYMRRKMYTEAREQLVKSVKLDEDNLGVRRAAVKLFAADPDQGPVKALRLLDKVVKKFGDMPILRLEKADLLTVINDENLNDQLFALTEGIDDWTTNQKIQLWRGLAAKFGRLRNEEARAECLQQVTALSPGDLPSLLELFEVARTSGDEQGMRDAQESIFDVVKSRENPTWLFTEAQRKLVAWRAAGGEGDALAQADGLVDQAIAKRGEWHELHNLKAQIALAKGDVRSALESYDKAADYGRQDARAMYQYVKLLMARGRFADALGQMEKISRDGRRRILGQDYAECLLRLGRTAEGVVAARDYAEQAPNSAPMNLWLGRYLSRAAGDAKVGKASIAEYTAEAGEAFDKAVQSDRNSAEAWLALVGYYAATKNPIQADDTIREAQLALVEDQSQLLFARCYEMVGRGIDAEALYRQTLDDAADSERARVSRLLAQFYLGPAYRGQDKAEKATPLINQVLKDVADGLVKVDDPHARWARTTAARLLAAKGTYQQLRDAERLLSTNAQDGALPVPDRLLMAEILSPRPEPVSRMKAVRLLEELGRNQRLASKSEMDLGKLYFALGEWRKCREKMLDLIAQNPKDPNVRLAYLEMLLQRGGPSDIDLAVRQVQRLREIAPDQPATREMLARIAFKKGRKNEAAKALLTMLPKQSSKITGKEAPLLARVAGRLVEFEDLDRAEKLYQLLSKVGGVGGKIAYAQFLGEHRDPVAGLDAMEELRGDVPIAQLIQRGLTVLRSVESRDGEASAEGVERVRGWLDRALREDPDLVALKLQSSELLDIQRKYDEAADSYRELLARDDLQGVSRAVVLNNLAYLLALAEKDKAAVSEATAYVGEAVEILGPGSEILDTRAVIAIADGRYDDAIADLDLALIDRPTASKYFHLAAAHSGAGNQEQAASAWEQAVEKGLTRESVNRLEREQFDRLEKQVGGEGLTSVTR